MTLGGQIRTSVRSVQAVGVSPKALSGGGPGGAGAPPGLLGVRFGKKQKEQKAESISKSHYHGTGLNCCGRTPLYDVVRRCTTLYDFVRRCTTLYDVVRSAMDDGQTIVSGPSPIERAGPSYARFLVFLES